jgi:hypothetical protein
LLGFALGCSIDSITLTASSRRKYGVEGFSDIARLCKPEPRRKRVPEFSIEKLPGISVN